MSSSPWREDSGSGRTKKTAVPAKERRLLSAVSCGPCPKARLVQPHQRSGSREHNNSVESTTGRFSDSRPTLRLLPIRMKRTVDYASQISAFAEQTLTAARPSRIFTAFPFDYPKAGGFATCSRAMQLAKNESLAPYAGVSVLSIPKVDFFIPARANVRSGVNSTLSRPPGGRRQV